MNERKNHRVTYMTLFGGYEELREVTLIDDNVDYICFTDDSSLKSDTWQIVIVEAPFPQDPIRSQRYFKICGHKNLLIYDEWLYVDNTVNLLSKPSIILDEWLNQSDLAIPLHSFRSTLQEEFDEVINLELDSDERVLEQLSHYRELHYEILETKPLWTGIIARRPNESVQKWGTIWWEHVLRYSRRDQLSVQVALAISGISFSALELDNNSSNLHEWPIHSSRKVEMRRSNQVNYRKISEHLHEQIDEMAKQYAGLSEQHHEVLNSNSWKITQPLRKVSAWVQAIRSKK